MNGVSVIIPTLNRGDFLKHTLECLKKQDFQGAWEVIIVDQSDKDEKELENIAENIRYYNADGKFKGLPEARNFGAQKAKYEILLYIDDDVDFDIDFVRQHAETYKNSEVSAVAGGITEKNKPNPPCEKVGVFHWFSATPERGYHHNKTQWVDHFPGGNYSIYRELYLELRGTDEYLNNGAALLEETELSLRLRNANKKIYFNPKAHLFHLAAPSGGCRIKDIDNYVAALVHNRSIVINRHLKWYHKPSAIIILLKLVAAYSVAYKNLSLFSIFINSYKQGRKEAKDTPRFLYFLECNNLL